jgi:hypothetical protein
MPSLSRCLASKVLLSLSLSLSLSAGVAAHAATASFDDLASLPAPDSQRGLFFANGDSLGYAGVTWDNRFTVVGDQYRVDTVTPGPLFGIPHSGNYFVSNEGDGALNDALSITTTMVLAGAWFGRNEYYGFGAGSDQITIHALGGSQVLSSVVFDLPDTDPGNPAPLQFIDTSQFAALSGITGYRIDRRELGTQSGNWIADDFTFVPATPVPEPTQSMLLLGGLGLLAALVLRRRS